MLVFTRCTITFKNVVVLVDVLELVGDVRVAEDHPDHLRLLAIAEVMQHEVGHSKIHLEPHWFVAFRGINGKNRKRSDVHVC